MAAGEGESLAVEWAGTGGALRFSTARPDDLDICREATSNEWTRVRTGGDYGEASRFPTRGVSAGWLRALVHAHHLFLGDETEETAPGLAHGLEVQRLLREALAASAHVS
jgi:predicted dehydrogenase